MIRHLLVCLLTFATLSAGICGIAQASVPASVQPAASPSLLAAGEENPVVSVMPAKRCKRGALPASPCGADLGLPVLLNSAIPAPCVPGLENRPRAMFGLPPSCLLGPPRSG